MNDRPTISVVMPVFNGAAYLGNAIESVLAQTLGDFELLVFDDGSTDETPVVLASHERRDSRIQVLRRSHRGLTPLLNEGLHLARGRFLARMDADDLCLADRFARQIAYLEEHPECVAVGAQVIAIDSDGDPLYRTSFPITHEEIDYRHVRGKSGQIAHPLLMARTDVLRAIGGYCEDFSVAQDFDLLLRLAEVGRLANLPRVLLKYREHPRTISQQHRERQLEAVREALSRAWKRRSMTVPPEPLLIDQPGPETVWEKELQWTGQALGCGYRRSARKHAWRAVRAKPISRSAWRLLGQALLSDFDAESSEE